MTLIDLERDAQLLRDATRHVSGSERAAEIVVATILGALAAAAVVHWMTPCEAGSLCSAAVTPLRLRVWQHLKLAVRRVLLRTHLRSFETEAAYWAEALAYAPRALERCERRIGELRNELIAAGGTAPELRQ